MHQSLSLCKGCQIYHPVYLQPIRMLYTLQIYIYIYVVLNVDQKALNAESV